MQKQRQRNEALTGEVIEAADEVRRAQKLEALGTLAAGMAHDFNNSLQVISSSCEVAQTSMIAKDQETAGEMVAQAKTAADQAATLTASMLSIAKQGPAKVEPIRLGDLLNDCIVVMRHTFPANISIGSDIAAECWCSLDEEQIRQAIINLMVNARDAMPNGGKLNVVLRKAAEENNVVVTIEDTGIGIPAADIDRVFEPFFTTKSRGEGTGLGLSTSHRIITSHDGTLSVNSSPNVGTCFEVKLPSCSAPSTSCPAINESRERSLVTEDRPRLILIADDQAEVRQSLRPHFELLGHRVLEAENGAEALQIADGDSFDAFILDVDMPILDGIEVARRLQQSGDDARVVMITGGSRQIQPRSNMVVLRKPFSADELMAAAFPQE